MALEHRNLKNNWSTTLQADAAAADTTLSLLQAWIDKLTSPNPSATEWYMLTLDDGVQAPEIVRCTGKGTGTITVVRQQEGTTAPTTWATGTKVEIRATAELLRVLEGAQYDTSNQTLVIGGGGAGRSISGAVGGVILGNGAGYEMTGGERNVLIGLGAGSQLTTDANNVMIGAQAGGNAGGGATTGVVCVGEKAGRFAWGCSNSVFIGKNADVDANDLSSIICIGAGAYAFASNQMVIGDSTARIHEVWIGGGVRDSVPQDVQVAATGALGDNIPGAGLRIAGGPGTGTQAGGEITFATASTGSSGTSQNALVDRMTIHADGRVRAHGAIETGDPGAGAGTWKLGTVQAGAVTLDTANYVEVDIGGTVVKLLKAA